MTKPDTILISIFKGILLSVVLLFLQIHFTSTASPRNDELKIQIEVKSQLPQDSNSRSSETFLKQCGGAHASGSIVVNREILYLFEIILSERATSPCTSVSIPIPLGSFLRILFSSAISMNAP